jgi:hypothetical protein
MPIWSVSSATASTRDGDRDAAVCADDFTLEDIPAGLTRRGSDGMRLWLQTWIDAAPDAHAARVVRAHCKESWL